MSRLARFVVRHRRSVILTWIIVLIVTATIGSSAFSVLSSEFGAGTSTESGRVAHELDNLAETGGQVAIIADGINVADPAVQQRITNQLAPLAQLDGVIDVTDPWTSGIDALRATDGRAALVVVTLAGDLDDDAELAVAQQWTPPRSSSVATCSSARPSPPPPRATCSAVRRSLCRSRSL
jgi:RND superfamily putative drug exporter